MKLCKKLLLAGLSLLTLTVYSLEIDCVSKNDNSTVIMRYIENNGNARIILTSSSYGVIADSSNTRMHNLQYSSNGDADITAQFMPDSADPQELMRRHSVGFIGDDREETEATNFPALTKILSSRCFTVVATEIFVQISTQPERSSFVSIVKAVTPKHKLTCWGKTHDEGANSIYAPDLIMSCHIVE